MADQYYVTEGYVEQGYYTYIADASIILDTSFEQSAIPDFVPGFNISLNSDYQISNIPEVNRSTTLAIDTIITLFEQSDRIRTDSSNLETSTGLTIDAQVIKSVDLALVSEYQQQINHNLISSTSVDLFTEINQTIVPTKQLISTIDLLTDYVLSLDESIIESETTQLATETIIGIIPNIITDTIIGLNTIYDQVSDSSKVVNTTIDLSTDYTMIAIGTIAQFKYVYMIQPETREYMIEYEEREYLIKE